MQHEIELPATREDCELADRIFAAVFKGQQTQGYISKSAAVQAGNSPNALSIFGWLLQQEYLKYNHGSETLGQVQTNGNPSFVREWDKRAIEEGMKMFEATPHGDNILVLQIFSRYQNGYISARTIVNDNLEHPEFSHQYREVEKEDLPNIIRGLTAAKLLEQEGHNKDSWKITLKGIKHLTGHFERLREEEDKKQLAQEKKEKEVSEKEEKEERSEKRASRNEFYVVAGIVITIILGLIQYYKEDKKGKDGDRDKPNKQYFDTPIKRIDTTLQVFKITHLFYF